MTIAEAMTEYLSHNENKIVEHGDFKAEDFNLLLRVLNETLDNFVIFNNSGGRRFYIWTMTPQDLEDSMKTSMKSYTYYYKLRGVEHFVQQLK